MSARLHVDRNVERGKSAPLALEVDLDMNAGSRAPFATCLLKCMRRHDLDEVAMTVSNIAKSNGVLRHWPRARLDLHCILAPTIHNVAEGLLAHRTLCAKLRCALLQASLVEEMAAITIVAGVVDACVRLEANVADARLLLPLGHPAFGHTASGTTVIPFAFLGVGHTDTERA